MSQNLDLYGGNYCTAKAGFTAGTTSTLSTANPVSYAINGKAYSKAATANATAPTLDASRGVAFTSCGPNKGTVYTLGFNAAGTLQAVQGEVRDLDPGGLFIDAPQFGIGADGFCPAAYMLVRVGSTGSAWTLGASNTAGVTGVTITIQDVLTMPARPQIL